MFLLRSVKFKDLDHLYQLSQLKNFISLPKDKDRIKKKIEISQKSFLNPSTRLWENNYIFVLEDIALEKVVGCSVIHAQHGTDDLPHVYLSLSKETKSSSSLNKSYKHNILNLEFSNDGPSEIGGLIIHPDYRGNSEKLGKALSFVRFLFIGIYPDRFKETIHAELMPPMKEGSRIPLWEAIGKKFLNMDYKEADMLSRNNKEFILNLYPKGPIYQEFLPSDAFESIGKIGKETLPVKHMLEKIGFKYTNQVDPFDGGPHYQASLTEVKRNLCFFEGIIKNSEKYNESKAVKLLISLPSDDNAFAAVSVSANIENKGKTKNIILKNKDIKQLGIKVNLKTNAIILTKVKK
ncbi:MAG: arginine N-succinyltransferase [Halobacteriovoraceae bacterium]|nr:arginine N-succinyltransferase [Halobacteriovoraceae bacterium]